MMSAMILAAGKGTRMGELTDNCPKPLLKVHEKSLIEYQIERLKEAGYTDIVINLAYLGDQIKSALGDGSAYGVNIQYSQEPEEGLETGGGILHALPLLTETFLVVNGDVWTDINYAELPTKLQGCAHLCLVDNPDHNPKGDFKWCENTKIVGLGDKRYTFSGVSVLSKTLFEGLNEGPFKLGPLLKTAMKEGAVTGQYHQGKWLDVGTPERLEQLAQWLVK